MVGMSAFLRFHGLPEENRINAEVDDLFAANGLRSVLARHRGDYHGSVVRFAEDMHVAGSLDDWTAAYVSAHPERFRELPAPDYFDAVSIIDALAGRKEWP